MARRRHDKVETPRDPRADTYPMPFVPFGWYGLLRSGELRPGKVVSRHYFGRALIAFRGTDGRATVRDAHCPHYGAHLGVGGKVVDGTVECPFHGWRFATDGRCVAAPFAARPPKVALGGFPVREHSGLVFVYVGPEAQPSWEVPRIPEATSRDFASPVDDTCRARIHVQEMRENIVDDSHFHFIHGQSEPPVQEWRAEGSYAEVRGRIRRRVLGWDIDNTFDAFMYGPGVMVVRTHGPALSVTAVALSTPVDETSSELRRRRSPRSSARVLIRQRARTGPYGAQKSPGSPIRVWREAVPVFMAAQRSPPDRSRRRHSSPRVCREGMRPARPACDIEVLDKTPSWPRSPQRQGPPSGRGAVRPVAARVVPGSGAGMAARAADPLQEDTPRCEILSG